MENRNRNNLSLHIDTLGDDLRHAVYVAAESGYAGVAVGISHPQLAAADFGITARRHFMKMLQSRNLNLAAVRVGAGAMGCSDWNHAERLIHQAQRAMQLARDCRAGEVVIYLGEPPAGKISTDTGPAASKTEDHDAGEAAAITRSVLDEVLAAADRTGIKLTLSCGHAAWLASILKQHVSKTLGAALDSGRVLAAGYSPPEAAVELAGMIHTWICADAVRSGGATQSVLLGSGRGDFRAVADVLDEQGFSGTVMVDIRGLADPSAAAVHAARLLLEVMDRKSSSSQRG
ncbi:MAG: sugar phosphate isomerase/epimerase family protein [Phycisphaerae bacterium]